MSTPALAVAVRTETLLLGMTCTKFSIRHLLPQPAAIPVRWALSCNNSKLLVAGYLRNTKFLSTRLVMQQSEGGGELDAKGCVDQEDGHDAGSEDSVLHTERLQEVMARFRQMAATHKQR